MKGSVFKLGKNVEPRVVIEKIDFLEIQRNFKVESGLDHSNMGSIISTSVVVENFSIWFIKQFSSWGLTVFWDYSQSGLMIVLK